jgi:AraC-like DNA-binding protein
MAHDVRAEHEAHMRSLYFRPDRCGVSWSEPTPVATQGLVGALLDHLTVTEAGPAKRRAERVLFDVIHAAPQVVLSTPRFRDDRVRRVADALSVDPSDARTLDEWGTFVGASGRTLARVIERETQTTFARWRNQLRIAHAARQLASGRRVAEVAHACGFSTPSAFVAAFRRSVGVTPGTYSTSARATKRPLHPGGVAVTVVGPGTVIDPTAR